MQALGRLQTKGLQDDFYPVTRDATYQTLCPTHLWTTKERRARANW